MFGFSRRRMKLGRLKVQLSDPAQGTKSPMAPPKRAGNRNADDDCDHENSNSDDHDHQSSSTASNTKSCPSGSSENWMVLSITGDKPAPRFNHAAAVVGNKMLVVGGEGGDGTIDDVQMLNFDQFTWTTVSSKLYLSPSSLPLKIPASKGHCLVSWGKKALMIGGKSSDPGSEKISVWAFDTETECWSLMEAKGDIPVARSGHAVVRANTVLILFGGEDSKKRKLNDLHMFDLKSMTWLPLQYKGTGPSPRSNHVAALYDDKTLFVFGGSAKSRTLNDIYSLDFETMVWSRIKVRGFHPSPRAGCCGVLCGNKWYITGGGSRKKRHSDTLIFDVLKMEWTLACTSPPYSVTANRGFSVVLIQHKEKDFLVAFGGSKKEPSNQVEVLVLDNKNEHFSSGRRPAAPSKVTGKVVTHRSSSSDLESQLYVPHPCTTQNLASIIDDHRHGSSRRSLSESVITDPDPGSGSVSLRKQFKEEEDFPHKVMRCLDEESSLLHSNEQKQQTETRSFSNSCAKVISEIVPTSVESESSRELPFSMCDHKQPPIDEERIFGCEYDEKSAILSGGGGGPPSNIYQFYESKMSSLVRKNGILEGQLAAALAGREAVEKNLSSVLRSRQETEKKLADTVKEMEMLKDKLSSLELAQEEANNLSNIVHSDNVRLEHDVAFLKAVLDDTQKELHSTRGLVANERARAFQLQVEVFHLKQRLQSLEGRAPTPRKPFQV